MSSGAAPARLVEVSVETPPVVQSPSDLESGLSKGRLPSLDGLRAFAAFAVVFNHYGYSWFGSTGALGVLAFFVLSGFLITWLLLKEEERNGKISLRFFYTRRSLRIFPAFYAYWFLIVGSALWLHKRVVTAQAIAAFFYVNNYYQALFGDPNTRLSHTWSLGIEEQFYLLWPLTFLLLRDSKKRMRFLASAIAAIWIYREVLVFLFHSSQGYIYEAFDTRADHLLLGCLLAVVLRQGDMPGLWRRLCSAAPMTWVTVGLILLSATIQNWTRTSASTTYRDAVGFIVDPILVGILIVQMIAFRDTGFGKILNHPWIVYLGTISYSVYLYQAVVIDFVKKATVPWPWLSLSATICVLILVASASYWLIEAPFLKLKDRFGRPPVVPATAPEVAIPKGTPRLGGVT